MNNTIVLLCGGNSIRFHENKLLYRYNGMPLYRYTFDKLKHIVSRHNDYTLLVVSQYESLLDEIKGECITVYSSDCAKGASYSIKVALDVVSSNYITFIVADQLFMEEDTIESFIESSLMNHCKIACIEYEGELYNPVIFDSSYIDELKSLEKDQGGKRIVKRHLDVVYRYSIKNPLELKDIDTKDEL